MPREEEIRGLIKKLGGLFNIVETKKKLVKIGVPAVPALVKALGSGNLSLEHSVLDTLVEIGPPAVPHLIISLGDKNVSVRENAAWALGEIKHSTAVPTLGKVLNDENEYVYVRTKAAEALGKIGDPDAIRHLIKALKDKDREVKKKVTWALGEIGKSDVILPLAEVLRDKNEDSRVKEMAAEALGKIVKKLKEVPPKEDEPEEAKALRLVGKYFVENEDANVVKKAFEAAMKKEIDEKNAAIYVKELRALKGNLK